MVEKLDPDNFPCFSTQEMCAMKLAAYVFNTISTLYGEINIVNDLIIKTLAMIGLNSLVEYLE